ncbi:MAG: hypothetical protein ABDH16_01110 [Thermodesulfovibrionaceae bacterium]
MKRQFKEILVCVIGATPQIITETLITTTIGKEKIQKHLPSEFESNPNFNKNLRVT